MYSAVLINCLVAFVSGQSYSNCDYSQNVKPGETYNVYNPNYPSKYPAGSQCRWIATCPNGYNCVLDCTTAYIPQSSSCSKDSLLVSSKGDPQLHGADVYCGRGHFTAVSAASRLSVGLKSSTSSTGGTFYCNITANKVIFSSETCTCGYKKSTRIVGGQETGINEYPMMAGVIYYDINTLKCGAVIIDKRVLMTAAHCLARQAVSNIGVVVGEHNTQIEDSPATQHFQASTFRIHPQYDPSTLDYDIALIMLDQDIMFSDRVGPVCLPFRYANTNFTGATVTFLGWGTQFPSGPVSPYLQKVDVQVISNSQCSTMASDITSRQMCTYTLGKDACQDDSGGPALWQAPSGLLYSLGIISRGQSCATRNQPGVNTYVAALLGWIKSATPKVTYCVK